MCLYMRNLTTSYRNIFGLFGVLGFAAVSAAQDSNSQLKPEEPDRISPPPSEQPLAPRVSEPEEDAAPSDDMADDDLPAENRPVPPKTAEPPSEGDAIPFEDLMPDSFPEPGNSAALPDDEASEGAAQESPDYSRLPESAERAARLDKLFERLQAEENADTANLIAEEIWAIWLDSGSASVNMLLRRGTAAQKRGNVRLARRMYNHVTELSPNYAEGWARSARLAFEEKDYSRALSEVTQALILEPRQFYAHWTLGNIFERIGRNEAALEAYREANRLYPELKAVKDRLKLMQGSVEGDVL